MGWPNSLDPPSWSPDGKLVAVGIRGKKGPSIFVAVANGGEPVILPNEMGALSASWLPDQSVLFLTFKGQIWRQPFPKGEPQRITNDLNFYGFASLTASGKQFATVQTQRSRTILVGAASAPDKSRPIGASRSDGVGLTWMPDGRLLSMDDSSHFWLSSAEGKDRISAFNSEQVFPNQFSICGGGSFLLLTRYTGAATTIGRVDITGRNSRQLTEGDYDNFADCSPDGKWIIYSPISDKGWRRLTKIPVSGSSAPENLLEKFVVIGRYSPDGKQIALLTGEDSDFNAKLAIMDAQTGRIKRTFEGPFNLPYLGYQWNLRWTADGKGITLCLVSGNTSNVWIQSISGGKPRQITHFPDSVVAYAWSRDGKRLAVTTESTSSDVVLFGNFR
jgi:Tol biopolymer transport system component